MKNHHNYQYISMRKIIKIAGLHFSVDQNKFFPCITKMYRFNSLTEKMFFSHLEMCHLPEIEKFLTRKWININVINDQGYTPLQMAIQQGNMPIVELLLREKSEQTLFSPRSIMVTSRTRFPQYYIRF